MFIDWSWETLPWKEQSAPPVSPIFMIVGIITVAAILITLILNPIRLAKRVSRTVSEEEASGTEAQASSNGTVTTQNWDLAYVWAYRLMVLGLDAQNVAMSTPGLTAREVAQAATQVTPIFDPQLDQFTQTFGQVRHGRSGISSGQVKALCRFTPDLLHACRDAEVVS